MADSPPGLSIIIFGDAKVGKTRLGSTAPAPRLILDAEGGSWYTPGRKKSWDPTTEAPPVADGTWETCIVEVTSYASVEKAYQWLRSGQHHFRSLVIDSVSEVQQRAVDQIAGVNQMAQQEWGTLLRLISELIRSCRDLVRHPTNPLAAVVYVAMEQVYGPQNKLRPFMQGQIGVKFPYYVDLCTYLTEVYDAEGGITRRLYTSRVQGYVTGERVGGCLGPYIDNPDLTTVVRTVYDYAIANNITFPSLNQASVTDHAQTQDD